MATWLPHLRLQFGGPLGPAIDEWSCSVRFKKSALIVNTAPSVELDAASLDAALAAMVAPLKAWFGNPNSHISSGCTMKYAKLAWILSTGLQRDVATHRVDFAAQNGAGAGNPHWFITQALTMRTAVSRGRAHSGRIFPPLVTQNVEAPSAYISVADSTAVAATWATCLNALSAAIQANDGAGGDVTPVYPVIASPVATGGPHPGPALLEKVTGVVADRVADVQHRRTNKVPRAEGAIAVVNAV